MKHKKYGKRLIAMFLALMMVLSTPSVALADEANTSAASEVKVETVENEVDEPEAEVDAEAETEAEEDLDAKAESAADAADEKEVLSTETQDTDTEKVSEDADTEENTEDADAEKTSEDAEVETETEKEDGSEKTDAENAVEKSKDEDSEESDATETLLSEGDSAKKVVAVDKARSLENVPDIEKVDTAMEEDEVQILDMVESEEVKTLRAAGDTLDAQDGVSLLEGTPSRFTFLRTNNEGSITKKIDDQGIYQRLPRNTLIDVYGCGATLLELIPEYYAIPSGASFQLSNPDILKDCSFSLEGWTGGMGYDNLPCLQFNYTAAKPGETTVTLTFYYNYNFTDGGNYQCKICKKAVTIPNNTTWYKETTQFTVVVKAELTDFSKELVSSKETTPDGITGITYPDQEGQVIISSDGTVTLLYKLKVSGEAGAAFTITDADAVLVGNYGSNIKQNVDGTIVGTIPDGQTSIDIYVTKEYTEDDIIDGKLSNTAKIAAGANTTLEGPSSSSADVPAEEEETKPDISSDTVKNILENVVKIDCTNEKANHADKLYDLIDDSYTIGTVEKDAESEEYTVDITVNSDKYVSQYNTDMSKEHTLSPEDQPAGTVVLIYDKTASNWKVKEDGQIPVVFTVICEDDSIQTSDCTLIKVFEGINAEQIPENFSIDASVTNDAGYSWRSVLNKGNAKVSSDGMTYTWTIKTAYYSGDYNEKYTNHVTLTEHNYVVSGYQNTIFYDSNGQYKKIDGDTIEFLIGHIFTGGTRRIKNGYTATSSPAYTVTYTDGVLDEDVFPDQVYSGLLSGTLTPKFNGTPYREGYIFKGWNPEVADTVTEDVIYTALWEKKDTIQYPVQLVIYHNGNTETPYKTVHLANLAKGETYDLTSLKIEDHYSEKNREDYEFEGWYNDGGWNSYKAGSKGNTLGNTITINGWTNIICMVTDYEKVVVKAVTNGDKENAQTIFNGTALRGTNLLEYLEDHVKDLDKEGYTLDKWFNWDWYGHKFGTETKVNGWTNVYVTYTINKYPVTLYIYKDGDTSKPVQTVEIGSFDYQTVLKNIASELNAEDYYTEQNKFAIGYEIEDAWYAVEPDDSMGAELADTDVVSVDGSSIACMVYDQYPVYYTIDGVRDSAYDVITAKTWQGYTLRVPEAKEGYEFDGWYQDKKDIGTDDKKIDRLKQLKKYELYGVYSPCKYTVTFDPGLGACDQKTKVVRFHSKYGNLPSAVREGYTFTGWTLNGNLITDKSVVKIPRDHTLTASYEANTYTIIYHGNGGYLTSNPEKDQTTSNWKYDQEVTLKNADTFTKENWAFLGWSTAPDGKAEYAGSQKGVFNFTAEPNGEIHLYAVWTPYQTPLDPIKAAYRVEHYKEQLDGTYKLAEAEFPVYVDVKDENGTLVEATAKAYDHYTENLTHSDRVASGIVKKPVWVDDNIEWEMVTLKLYYDLDEYEVVFEAGANGTFQNGETKVSGNHKYGALYPETPVVTAQKGYVFAGWFTEGKKAEDFPETVTADAVYTAQYKEDKNNNGIADDEEEKYTVTYTDGVAKEEIFKDQVTGNLLSGTATPVFQGTPSRSGYVFGGWNPAVAATVTGNAVYTAVWKEDRNNNGIADDTETKYSVTYNDGVDDEEIFKDQVYTDLLSGTATPGFVGTPDRDGYTFKGWSPEISEKVNGTVTYRATWDKNSSGKKKHHHSGSSEDTNTGSAAAPAANSQPAATASPQTGDSNPIIPMFALAIASLLGITLVLAGRKKKDAKA